jgi:GntR family transcriptional regulator
MYIDKQGDPAGGGADAPSRITFRLDPASGVPTYLQLVHQVEQALRLGYLARGDQLPRVKDVVGTLAINPNTVLKAYRELEQEGLVEGRQGVGTFALRRPAGPAPSAQAALTRSLARWIEKARAAGLDDTGMEALLRGCLMSTSDAASA